MNQDNTIQTRLNTITFGLIAGMLFPLLALIIFYLISSPDVSFSEFVEFIVSRKKLSSLISLSVVPDLLVFFIFIRLNYLYSARGVLAAVFLFALIVVLTKFLI
ncbi:MAG: hypothetical protein KAI95_00210 [Bacteroidales bacterium]|nr:hypothetical protein [Bacteroidales bacterium]